MLKLKSKVLIGVFALVLVTAAIPVCDYLVNINAPDTSADTLEDGFAAYSYSIVSGGILITDINTTETGVTELTIPETIEGFPVERLDAGAFYSAESLENIVIPKTVKVIADTAFNRLPNLQSVTVDSKSISFASDGGALYTKDMKTLVRVPVNSPVSSFVIPDSVTKISARAFYGCKNVNSVQIGAGLTEIADFAFGGTTALSQIYISAGVTKIAQNAFADASALSSITVDVENKKFSGDGIALYSKDTLIAYPAARKDSSYTVRNGTTTIGLLAFNNAVNLKSISFCGSEQIIQSSAFAGSGIEKVEIPEYVEVLKDSAFAGCPNLKEVTIKGKDTFIGVAAFSDCTALETFTFNDFITTIEMATFMGDTSLKNVKLPSALVTIGQAAFTGCTSLTEIDLPGKLRQIKTGAFLQSGVTSFKIPGNVNLLEDAALGLPFSIDENIALDENADMNELMGLMSKTITVEGFSTVNNQPGVVKAACDTYGYVFKDLGNYVAKKGDLTGDGTVSVEELNEIIRVVLGQQAVDAYNNWLEAEADKKGFSTSDLASARRNLIYALQNANKE